jgi:hypothetical protein
MAGVERKRRSRDHETHSLDAATTAPGVAMTCALIAATAFFVGFGIACLWAMRRKSSDPQEAETWPCWDEPMPDVINLDDDPHLVANAGRR